MARSDGIRAPRLHRSIVARTMAMSTVAFLGTSTAPTRTTPNDQTSISGSKLSKINRANTAARHRGQPARGGPSGTWRRGYKGLIEASTQTNPTGPVVCRADSVVVNQPNLSGIAIVWWFPIYNDRDGSDGPSNTMFHSRAGRIIRSVMHFYSSI